MAEQDTALTPGQVRVLRHLDPEASLTREAFFDVVVRTGQIEMRDLLDWLATT